MERIIVIGENFPPRLGGGRRLFELMKKLNHKYDIRFVTIPSSYLYLLKKKNDKKRNKKVIYEGIIGHHIKLPINIYKLWSSNFYLSYVLTMFYLFFKLFKMINNLNPKLIILDAPNVYSGLLGFLVAKTSNKKILVEFNDIQSHYASAILGDKFNTNLLKFFIIIENTIIRHASKVTAISSYIKNYAISKKLRDEIIVITDGVDRTIFNPQINGNEIRKKYNLKKETKVCIYTGRIERVVGAELISVIAEKLAENRKFVFMVVGEGDYVMTDKLSNQPNVILTGLVPKDEIPKYLAAADFVLVPFISTVATQGISPLKLFEALSMGKPVLASPISGVNEVVKHNFDSILLPYKPDIWVSSLIELMSDEKKIKNLRENAINTSKKYDWTILAERFNGVIESTLN